MTPTDFRVALLAIAGCPILAAVAYIFRRRLGGCLTVAFIVAMFGMAVIGFFDAVEYMQAAAIVAH